MQAPGVKFSTPPSGELDVDDDHEDDVPIRFRTLENILGTSSPPDLAEQEVAEELMVAVREEPATADKRGEAQQGVVCGDA